MSLTVQFDAGKISGAWLRGKQKEICVVAQKDNSPSIYIGYYDRTNGEYSGGMIESVVFNKQEEAILQRYNPKTKEYTFLELDQEKLADKFKAFLDDLKTCIK